MASRCYMELILLIVIVVMISGQTTDYKTTTECQNNLVPSSGLTILEIVGIVTILLFIPSFAMNLIFGILTYITTKRAAKDRRELEMAVADTDRQRRTGEPEDSPDGNLSGQADDASEPLLLLDIQLSGIDILAIVKIFTLDELNDVYPHLKKLKTKDFSDILQQDKILQKQTGKILNLWISRNGNEATRNVLIKEMEKCDNLVDSLSELRKRWRNTDLDQPVSEVDIQDIYDTVSLHYLDDVYPYLLPKHKIENIKQETKTPPTEQQAKKLFYRWIDRNGIEATRKKIIEAIEKSPDCKGKLGELKREWKAQDTQ